MLHDRYIMEKFRDGKTGKGTTTPNPKFNFTQPKFKKKDIDLDKLRNGEYKLDEIIDLKPQKNGRVNLCHPLNTKGGVHSEFTIAKESDDSFYLV